tara:strand:+ start:6981 stop:7271 length:291 start_codon:yes stop_codon:yes gene_type:complete
MSIELNKKKIESLREALILLGYTEDLYIVDTMISKTQKIKPPITEDRLWEKIWYVCNNIATGYDIRIARSTGELMDRERYNITLVGEFSIKGVEEE